MHFQEPAGGLKYPGLLWCFILHCEALPLLPLRNRTAEIQGYNTDLDAHLQGNFLPKVFSVIDTYLSEWDLDLDLDGNVFTALLGVLLPDTKLSLRHRLGDSLSQIGISTASPSDHKPHLKTLRSVFPVQVSHPLPSVLAVAKAKLLPFHHDVFDKGFSLIDLPSDDSEEDIEYRALEFGKGTAFYDQILWDNTKRHIISKHLGGEQAKHSDERQRMKMMKMQQRFMSRLTVDAATLAGTLGARFDRLTIVTGGTEDVSRKDASHPVCCALVVIFFYGLMCISQTKGHKKTGKKEKPMSSKEKLLAEISAKKLKKDTDEQQEWWQGRLRDLSGHDLEKNMKALAVLEQNPRTTAGWLRDEILLYRLHLIISKWISQISDQDTGAVRDHYTVSIMRTVKELSESKHLTPAIHREISTVLNVLGFESFVTPPISQLDRPLCFKFVKLVRSKSGRPLYEFMRITEDPVTWQLRLFGEFLDRSTGSKPDPRVSFTPDAWQREVLDCLDRNESILVGEFHVEYFSVYLSHEPPTKLLPVEEKLSSRST